MEDVHKGLWQGEERHNKARPGEESEQPEHPTPRNASDSHKATNSRPECRARERRESEEGQSFASGVRVPDIRHYSAV